MNSTARRYKESFQEIIEKSEFEEKTIEALKSVEHTEIVKPTLPVDETPTKQIVNFEDEELPLSEFDEEESNQDVEKKEVQREEPEPLRYEALLNSHNVSIKTAKKFKIATYTYRS